MDNETALKLSTIDVESRDGVTLVTLNRPQWKNAINVTMVRELEKLCYHLEDHSADRVVVFRGAGEHFCAGIDLRDFPPDKKPDVRGFSRWERACRTVERLSKVTVAAVDGTCAGGGLQLALTCDLRVAAPGARFELHELRDGFLPGMGTFRLAKYIGLGRARQLALTGRAVAPEEAQAIGLVDRLCDGEPDGLSRAVDALVAELGEVHPEVVALSRRLFDESFEIPYAEFLGCFLAAQHRAIQGEAFKARIAEAHRQGLPRPRAEEEPGQ